MNNDNNQTPGFKTGDLVVGSSNPAKSVYSPDGRKLDQAGSLVYGPKEELDALGRDILKSATMGGGKVLPVILNGDAPKKKGRKKVQAAQEPHPFAYPIEPAIDMPVKVEEAPQLTIQFENDFGKIKAKVEDVVEEDLAFMLVFSDEDAVVFEPKVGEMLILHTPDRYAHNVYYPGVTFNFPNSDKKLMMLFKVPASQEE